MYIYMYIAGINLMHACAGERREREGGRGRIDLIDYQK